ncbi:helix-turn-helix transcriptional regulator [Lactiplantibacillus pingfangensis]|uniref:helix-turn-helix transcriptional regulator n=1 Tax=Lactiplantibacillus pingfangensis TaxID=2559915 RepID=UPI0010F58B8A|nr:helix-turn-helix transcriptional regulator [Lactiplantibacillus pingfangensis]
MYKVELDSAIEMEVAPTTSAADVLKETMAYHHITQTDFAAHIAISQKQLSVILNRRAFMSIAVAKQIEQATGLSAKWLLQLDFNYRFSNQTSTNHANVEAFDWATA